MDIPQYDRGLGMDATTRAVVGTALDQRCEARGVRDGVASLIGAQWGTS
jgi:hypothetical protein